VSHRLQERQSNRPHRVFGILTVCGSRVLLRKVIHRGWCKIRKGGISRNLLFLVPEAGVEPARVLWTRGILSPPSNYG
jgi:hypothetical protein